MTDQLQIAGQAPIQLTASRYVLGCQSGCDVVLQTQNGTVSRQHAALERNVGNQWSIVDLNSTNGVYVNEQRVTGSQVLSSGANIRIGDNRLTLQMTVAPDNPTLFEPHAPADTPPAPPHHVPYQPPAPPSNGPNKVTTALMAFFFGQLGIHKFILGYTAEGLIMLLVGSGLAWFTCFLSCFVMWIIAVIEGIIYLTKSDEEFYQTYVVNKRGWF